MEEPLLAGKPRPVAVQGRTGARCAIGARCPDQPSRPRLRRGQFSTPSGDGPVDNKLLGVIKLRMRSRPIPAHSTRVRFSSMAWVIRPIIARLRWFRSDLPVTFIDTATNAVKRNLCRPRAA